MLALEELNRALVLLRGGSAGKCAEVSSATCSTIDFLRVQPVLARLQLANHVTSSRIVHVVRYAEGVPRSVCALESTVTWRGATLARDSKLEGRMRKLVLTVPEVAFIAATRGALGFGAGLLFSGKLNEARRRMVGLSLVAIGVATTIPAARRLFGRDAELKVAS